MRTTVLALAGTFLFAAGALAQTTPADTGCGTPPCATSAPGGTTGSGPTALRNTPAESPVGTGSGSSGGKSTGGGAAAAGGANGAGKSNGGK